MTGTGSGLESTVCSGLSGFDMYVLSLTKKKPKTSEVFALSSFSILSGLPHHTENLGCSSLKLSPSYWPLSIGVFWIPGVALILPPPPFSFHEIG